MGERPSRAERDQVKPTGFREMIRLGFEYPCPECRGIRKPCDKCEGTRVDLDALVAARKEAQ